MNIPFIPFEQGEALLDWQGLCEALVQGHTLPKAEIGDTFLYRGPDTLLSRAAWIDGLGMAVKTATIFPDNPARERPVVNGALCLYSDRDGALDAVIDFHLVTKWKTAGDSLLAALRLASPESRDILIVGAGTVGRSLCAAFGFGFPQAQIHVWNRTSAGAEHLAADLPGVRVAEDLQNAVQNADIVACATMSTEPLVRGEWLRPGQHLNLVGAYRPDMREADDTALQRARIFVDSIDTTVKHIGELKIPISQGVISEGDVIADFYDIAKFTRRNDAEITLFKNGGGAHLDLMTSRYILDKWQAGR